MLLLGTVFLPAAARMSLRGLCVHLPQTQTPINQSSEDFLEKIVQYRQSMRRFCLADKKLGKIMRIRNTWLKLKKTFHYTKFVNLKLSMFFNWKMMDKIIIFHSMYLYYLLKRNYFCKKIRVGSDSQNWVFKDMFGTVFENCSVLEINQIILFVFFLSW